VIQSGSDPDKFRSGSDPEDPDKTWPGWPGWPGWPDPVTTLIRTCCLSHWDRCGKSSKGILFIVHAARLEIFNFVQDKKLLLFMPYILPFLCFKLGYLLTPPMLFNSLNRHVLLHNLHYISAPSGCHSLLTNVYKEASSMVNVLLSEFKGLKLVWN